MSVLVVGLSHKTAPIELLERVSLDTESVVKLSHRALETPYVSEAAVISTCNRVEVYVEAERFHGAVEEVSTLLAEHAGLDRDAFVRHAYVHYDDAAVAHLFEVAAGLDSMIIGESQILGQVRDALQLGQDESTVGSALNTLFQQALRIGKRGHAETGIDLLGPSIVTASLDAAGPVVHDPETRFLVIGAGTMSSLAVKTLVETGVSNARIMVANRTYQRAYELVETYGVGAVRWGSLDNELHHADVVITCTGASGLVLDRERIERAQHDGRPLTLVDMALPRDVDASVADMDGVTLVDIALLAERGSDTAAAQDITAVRSIVDAEVEAFLAAKAAARVTPTVVALRTMATEIVSAEMDRFARRNDVSDEVLAEVRHTVNRVADKILHAPTVRVQQLVDGDGGLTYADALADLFALDPAAIAAVTKRSGEKSDKAGEGA